MSTIISMENQESTADVKRPDGNSSANVVNNRNKPRNHRGRGGSMRGRGDRRGRGRSNGSGQFASTIERTTSLQRQPAISGDNSTSEVDAQKKEQEQSTLELSPGADAEICFICASPVVHNSIAPCGHRTCHICALRLRALYKNKSCAHCRTNAGTVIFTDDPVKQYKDFAPSDFAQQDTNLGINYEKQEIYEDTLLLLRYNCPDSSCDVACYGWPDLQKHVKSVHHKVMCDLCVRNKKVFTHEHELFSPHELKRHEKTGDDRPGAADQSGFKGHPECGFCHQRFYDDDALYTHCREHHERCHVCDRRTGGRQPQYYVNYEALELHFQKDHFQCPDQECLEKKFVVFDSEMDLKAHQLEVHPNGLTRDARRDARRVDMSSFDYRTSQQQERSERGRGGRGRGRGRDPNADPLPVSSAQPLRRDEVAFQRQMAVQSAQSVTTRNFGGQLTSAAAQQPAYAAKPPPGAQDPPSITLQVPTSSETNPSNVSRDPSPSAALLPQDQVKRLRQAAVVDRASQLLENDAKKVEQFRNQIATYVRNGLSAQNLLDNLFSLFDASPQDIGKLIHETADTFDETSKRVNLLKAWSDWRAINEDYPTLPGSSILSGNSRQTAGSSTWASNLAASNTNSSIGAVARSGAASTRILRLKSSTAQSQRISKNLTVGNQTDAFPSLPLSSAPSSNVNTIAVRHGSGAKNTVFYPATGSTWIPPTTSTKVVTLAAPVVTATTSRPVTGDVNVYRMATKVAGTNKVPTSSKEFPSLPPGKSFQTTTVSPGYKGNVVLRPSNTDSGNTNGSSWGGKVPDGLVGNGDVVQGVDQSTGGKQGKKSKVYFNWG